MSRRILTSVVLATLLVSTSAVPGFSAASLATPAVPSTATAAASGARGEATATQPAARRPPGHEPRFADDHLLVGFEPGTSRARVDRVLRDVGGTAGRRFAGGARLVQVPKGSVEAAIARLQGFPDVRYAEPDYIVELQQEPDDPSLDDLWGLINTGQVIKGTSGTPDADIDADLAWDVTTGSSSVVVGVVDTGVDQNHPDLAANLWQNPGGIGGCGAGTHGYSSLAAPCQPEDDHDHGTHVSGTIGAVGDNGRGVAGVNWTTRIMALKAFDSTGYAETSWILETLDFAIEAADAGVPLRVINASWGDWNYSQATVDAISALAQRDVLFVAAAGNFGFPNDWFPFYPCAYELPSVICVAASDQSDELAYFSNFGTETVDLAAPGVNVFSTVRNGGYAYFDGTSMATPHVTGAAALVLARSDVSVSELRDALLATVDQVPGLAGTVATGGRLNVATAVNSVSPLPRAPVLSASAESGVVHLSWTEPAPGEAPIDSYRLYRGATGGPLALLATFPAAQRTHDDTTVVNEVAYDYAVSAVSALGEGTRSAIVTATPPAPPAVPDAPTLTALADDGSIHLCWTQPFDGRSAITGYRLYRSAGAAPWESLASPGPTPRNYEDGGLTNGASYAYSVSAVNSVGEGPLSAEAVASPAAGSGPTISGFSPTVVAQGGQVTISGTNFATGACLIGVTFDTLAGGVDSTSSTQVVARAPAAGGSGPLSLTTAVGSAVSATDLFVVPAPYGATDVGSTGRLAFGSGRLVSLSSAGKIGLALFAGAAGDRVSLNVTGVSIGQSDISILKPDGTTLVAPRYVTTSGTFFDTLTLPQSGTYLVLVDPRSTYSGNATLTAYQVPADATATLPLNGSATLTTTVPGQNASGTFTGATGQRVSLNVTNVTVSQSDISILKPDGSTLVAPRYVTTSGTFFETMTLPADGQYRVVVNPRVALMGSLRLSLYEVPADATATGTIGGAATSLAVTVPGQNASLFFQGALNQRVSMMAGSVTVGQSDISILKPDGTTLVAPRYVTGTTFFDAMTLPAVGTYRVFLNPRAAFTGSVTFTLYDVPPDVTAAITPGGPAVMLTNTVPGQNGALTFSGSTGQRVSLNVTGVTASSDVSIRKPDGSTLVASRYVAGNTFLDTVTLPVNGIYRITWDPRAQGTGSTTFTLYNVPPDPTISLTIGGAPGTVTTTVPGQNASATFAGSAGQSISLVLSAVTITQSDVSILKPDGSTLVSPQYVTTSGKTINATLPVAGTYRIFVNPRNAYTGNMTLDL